MRVNVLDIYPAGNCLEYLPSSEKKTYLMKKMRNEKLNNNVFSLM